MSGLHKETRTDPVAGSSSMIEPTLMVQSQGYFNTDQPTSAWTGTSACSQLCRMCATENEYLIPIFEGEGVEHQLGMKIDKHLPIRVHLEDTLPLHVCYQCASTLIAWHDLVAGCIEAEKKLIQIQTHGRAEAQVEEVDVKSADSALFFPEQMDTEASAEPSTSGTPSVPTRQNPKKTVPKANPKLKMVVVKTPTAPSAASRVVAPKTEAIPDTAERSASVPPVTFEAFQLARKALRPPARADNVCLTCGEIFARRTQLARHVNAAHPTRSGVVKKRPSASYTCDQCGRKFALKDSFCRHRRIHSGERPFTCHVCGKQFRDSGGLARHLKDVHVGIKAFACELCGRAFASKATRDDHRRTHTGERPYVCAACGKAFKSKASLYTHAKVHTDVFPHECTDCDKRFRRRQEMLAHVSTHTGDKPHACDSCSKSFRVRGELLRHKLVHSDAKPFVCVVCSQGFRQKRYLKNHEKSRHSALGLQ